MRSSAQMSANAKAKQATVITMPRTSTTAPSFAPPLATCAQDSADAA
jgi:hypothetical protein